jgi:hypothetical protein
MVGFNPPYMTDHLVEAAMSAQVEFFCTPDEERDVLRYLTKTDGTQIFDVREGRMVPWKCFAEADLPAWPEPVHLYIWKPDHGSLVWHTSRPSAAGPTHQSLVVNFFAGEQWDELGLYDGDEMLDADLSPILCYRRGILHDGKVGQNTVLAPPSNLRRVGPEYEKWVKRSLSWIRRRGKIVHDYRSQTTTIPNPHSILNTIYAFPGVIEEINSNAHDFAIVIQ